MKKYLMMGVAAVAFASCSHDFDLYDPSVAENMVVEKYNQAFIQTFGQPAANQTWGFGDVTRGVTRGAETWDGTHTCFETNWEDKLKDIKLPDGAFQLDQEGNYYYNQYAWPEPANVCKIPNNVTVMYLSEDFDDVLRMDGNIPAGAVLYNYGTVQGFSGNFSGTITIYNLGTMTYNPGSQDHNIYNTGTLYIKDNDACAKILTLYNTGSIEFGGSPAQLHSKSTYYSNGKKFSMPNGGVIESKCDIHETITVKGDLNIQTGTDKKICGIEATGRVQNTAGRLEVSYIKANDIYFEGNNIYLNPEGYLEAETMEFDKAACDVHAAEGSNALVKVTKKISFKNDNDFNRTFSDNIYFKIDGSIDMNGQTNGGFTDADRTLYNSAADYIAKHGNPNEKLNAGYATGSPACGDVWTVGTPDDNEFTFLCRVFAEDLSAENATDFDFNDVVFDVYNNVTTGDAKIIIMAAGGTLPLTVAGEEVHGLFGVSMTTMVNTNATDGATKDKLPVIEGLTGIKTVSDVNKEIKIIVTKGGKDYELEAKRGEPAAKFAVTDQTVDWANERQDITEKYEKFGTWVKKGEPAEWWK